MNFYLFSFLLGYLCFCVVNTIDISEISEKYNSFDNCTQCVEKEESCICFEYIDKCVICCSGVPCCICEDCAVCWHEQRQLIIMTQIGICVLFAFGIIGLIVVYCKICNRVRQHTHSQRRPIILQEARDLTTQCSLVENLQERPPSYNEVVRSTPPYTSSRDNAPPLYTSPYSRTSMQEAPPSHPGTPKPPDKLQISNETPCSFPAAQHM